MREFRLITIYQDRCSSEYAAVSEETDKPVHYYTDGGNMWGNRQIPMTWEEVEALDPKFKGINDDNWQDYVMEDRRIEKNIDICTDTADDVQPGDGQPNAAQCARRSGANGYRDRGCAV